ncbi:MAG: stage sporulation protein [Thermosediminibacterales bacterium]|nr:stage sporulation protein [Thermosediminibacterales bacterium]MDK2835257.1 stage sporulation protein [Thermosediminibacterales bacterium]
MCNKKVIIVTDGDSIARQAIETASRNVGTRCISLSAGNPTPINADEMIKNIKKASGDIVVCMVDDRGNTHAGVGEQVMKTLLNSKEIEVIGVVAVASNTEGVNGITPDYCITRENKKVKQCVNKYGEPIEGKIFGDTVDTLKNAEVPIIIGIGDPGKMNGRDDCGIGAPITTSALKEIINNYEKKTK